MQSLLRSSNMEWPAKHKVPTGKEWKKNASESAPEFDANE